MWFALLVLMLAGWRGGTVVAEEFYQDNRGITTVYQDRVPQVGKNGELKYSYDENSFFPLVMYFTDLGDKGQIKQWLGLDATKSRDTLGEVKSAGFNTSFPAWPFPTENELAYFDSMGMKILPNVSDIAWRAANNKDGWTMQKLKDVIAATKNHPSILAWHLFDEEPARTAHDMDNDKWKAVHDAIKSADPTRLVFANNYKANCMYDYFSDVSNIDKYVVGEADSGLRGLVKETDSAVACNLNEPAWVIVQTFTDDSSFHWTMPSAAQIRAQLYAAIAHGATGLWAFLQHTPWAWRGENATRWDQPDPEGKFLGINPQVTPDLWAEVTRSNKEIDQYKHVWLAKTSSEGYTMAFTKRFDAEDEYDVPIRTILKDTGDPNKRYLLAVNITAVPIRTRMTMSGTVVTVNSLFNGQVINPVGNSWIEDIPGYGVKLYEVWKTGMTVVGDADGNGKVNVADFAIWKTEYLTKNGIKSDFDKNGRVTIGDFAVWKTEYLRGK